MTSRVVIVGSSVGGVRTAQALRSYERCLQLDSAMADAHFNAARLHERLGRKREALRHYSAYRRLAHLS